MNIADYLGIEEQRKLGITMKSFIFLSVTVLFSLAPTAAANTLNTVSDTASPLSDTSPDTAAPNRASIKQDLIAKRRLALKSQGKSIETCESRKAKAKQKLARLKQDGVADTSSEWRQANRQVTILNSRCPEFRNTSSLVSNMCDAREMALLKKLQGMKNNGFSDKSEEVKSTNKILASVRAKCGANSSR